MVINLILNLEILVAFISNVGFPITITLLLLYIYVQKLEKIQEKISAYKEISNNIEKITVSLKNLEKVVFLLKKNGEKDNEKIDV